MRIGQYSNITMGSTLSGSKKIGGVSLPDFNGFQYCTKTSPAMSQDKFKAAIIAQAEKDQAAGKYYSQACKPLQKQYVSVASPDRKGFITDALTQISKKSQPQPKTLNLIELLLGKVKYEKIDGQLNYAEFMDNNGEHLATFSNGEWTFYGTKDEIARETEFFSIYREAWNTAAKSANTATEINISTGNESAIDIKA